MSEIEKKLTQSFTINKQETQGKGQRTSKYELLRFIAALFVLTFHSILNRGTWTWSILNTFLVIPVPLFIFLSGFFLANSKKAKILKYLWMLLFFYLINIFISYFFFHYNLIHEDNSLRISYAWILKFGWGPWWYFWTIPILYLMAPFLNFGLKSLNKWFSLSFIMIFYTIWFFTMNINYFPKRLVDGGQIIFFIIIYMLGAWWKLYASELKIQNIAWKVAITFLSIMQIINVILFATLKITLFTMGKHWIVDGQGGTDWSSKDTVQPLSVLAAMSMFIIFQKLNWKYNKVFNFLGKLSTPIFLYHFAFLNIVTSTIGPKIFPNISSIEITAIISVLLVALLSITFSVIIIMPVEYLVAKGVLLSYYLVNKVKTLVLKKQKTISEMLENQITK